MKRCLIGVVSWCDSKKFPERFKVFKRAANSINKFIDKKSAVIAVVDNDSSSNVKKYIESSPVFDIKVLLPENIHDVGAYAVLTQIAKDKKLPFILVLENDYVLFKKVEIDDYTAFLDNHQDTGYIRLQKFEFSAMSNYDKLKNKNPGHDKNNAVWLKNIESDSPLNWEGPYKLKQSKLYKTNWHFGLHGGLTRLDTWEKIFPSSHRSKKLPFYYKLEDLVRKNYAKLKLKTAQLDGGVFSMEAPSVYKRSLAFAPLRELGEMIFGKQGGFVDSDTINEYLRSYQLYFPNQIQLFSNSLGEEELQQLSEVFKSKWLGYGKKSHEFENEFAQMLNCKYALAISSCTAGLFMSMEILNIGPGDEVIMPSISFIACANSVIKSGAKIVFADCHPRTLNISPHEVKKLISRKTKAIILLHYGGFPADVDAIKKILKSYQHKIYLIEDSANSIRSKYKNKYCGALGDIGLFSLDANKVISTGTGGMLITNDEKLYHKAKVMRFYGLKPSQASGYDALKAKRERWWEIELEYHGNRYLANDITSAIGLAQLAKLDSHIKGRIAVWKKYNKLLINIRRITLPPSKSLVNISPYFYWIQVENENQQLSLANFLVNNGIYTTFRYYPLHLVDYYKAGVRLPISEKIAQTTLNLPFHHNLTDSDINRIVNPIKAWSESYKN